MLEKIRNNTQSTFAKVILGIIIVPFALFGIDSYLSSVGSNVYAAKVNSESISVKNFQDALIGVRNQMANQSLPPDSSAFETPEFKKAILDGLITSRLVNQEIKKSNFIISQAQLNSYILGMPAFQKNGKFDQDSYDQIAKNANLTPRKLDEEIRKDLAKQQVKDSLSKLIYALQNNIKPLVNLAYQKRDVSLLEMKLDDYKNKINITDEAISKFYKENISSFNMPDQVKINFLVYSVSGIIPEISVIDDEIKAYFDQNIDKFQADQQRRAKHILFGINSDMPFDKKQKVKELAESILIQLRNNPKKFDDFAKKHSQDSESAKKGGDLGLFTRGMMVKEFDNVVFTMKVNDLSGIVETQFGYHIIKLTEIKGEEVTFDSVKSQLKGELLFTKAQNIYLSGAEDFNNIVYEQSESLKATANKFGLEIQESQWLTPDTAKKFFNNESFAQAIFDRSAIADKRNIAAIEVSPNNLISARVIDFKPSSAKPIKAVKDEINDFLTLRDAQKLLIKEGDDLIKSLKEGTKKAEWIDEMVIDRIDRQGLSEPMVNAIYKIDDSVTPNFEGIYDPNQREYVIVRLNKVINEEITEQLSIDIYKDEYVAALKEEIESAFINDLRSEASIEYNPKFLNLLTN